MWKQIFYCTWNVQNIYYVPYSFYWSMNLKLTFCCKALEWIQKVSLLNWIIFIVKLTKCLPALFLLCNNTFAAFLKEILEPEYSLHFLKTLCMANSRSSIFTMFTLCISFIIVFNSLSSLSAGKYLIRSSLTVVSCP